MNKRDKTILDDREIKKIEIDIRMVKSFITRLQNEQQELSKIDHGNDGYFDVLIRQHDDRLNTLKLQLQKGDK